MCQQWRLLCVLLMLASSGQSNISGNVAVIIFKCCPRGETPTDDARCSPNTGHWAPLVYSPSRRAFLPPGTTPPHWSVVEATKPSCRNNVSGTLMHTDPTGVPAFLVFDNGSLWLQESRMLLHTSKYCVDYNVAIACLNDDVGDMNFAGPDRQANGSGVSRVKKCCGEGAVYSETAGACVTLVDHPGFPLGPNTLQTAGFPICAKPKSSNEANFVIAAKVHFKSVSSLVKDDGSLHLAEPGLTLRPGEYCLEHVFEHATDVASVFACHSHVIAAPTRRITTEYQDLRFTLYPIGLFLSVFFLAATLAAGCLLPTAHHMLHWRCQTGHVACLLVGDLLLAITQVGGHTITGGVCVALAIIMHFFFLAAFFWLNTMCFNIWWTFRDFRPASLDKKQESCRLLLFQLYAWGGPLVIAGLAAILDNLPAGSQESILRPRFGEQRCWFYGDVEVFPYFYAPVGILLLVNLLLFGATARELTCGLWKREMVKSNTERAKLGRVCLKLVVVMGLTWVIDIISWVVGGPSYVWYLPDLINTLQGVFIFAVVGCHPQVWAAVKRLWCLGEPHRNTTYMGNQNMSSCSQGLQSTGDSTLHNTSSKMIPLETLC